MRWSKGSDEKADPRPPPPSKNASFSSGKYFGEMLDQELGQPARILRHLDHRPVAGGENADERRKAQQKRIVPGNDDADHAERLGHEPIARAEEHQQIDAPPARLHPAFQALRGVVDSVQNQEHLAEQRLELAAIAVVSVDRCDDRRLVVLDETRERLEVGDPLVIGRLGRLQIGGALGGEAGLELGRHGDVGRDEGRRVHRGLASGCFTSGKEPKASGEWDSRLSLLHIIRYS